MKQLCDRLGLVLSEVERARPAELGGNIEEWFNMEEPDNE